MNPYWLLIPVFALCVVGSALSYTDSLRQHRSYIPLMVIMGGVCAGLFAVAARLLDEKSRVYVFSLWYDSLMALCYYLLPLVIFGTRVKPGVLVGAVFVVVGLAIVKACE